MYMCPYMCAFCVHKQAAVWLPYVLHRKINVNHITVGTVQCYLLCINDIQFYLFDPRLT